MKVEKSFMSSVRVRWGRRIVDCRLREEPGPPNPVQAGPIVLKPDVEKTAAGDLGGGLFVSQELVVAGSGG